MSRVITYREALNEALREELAGDASVVLMGEDIGAFGGAFKVTDGLLAEFGERRVRDTPISENAIVGMGTGAAMSGLRPVVELMTINFSLLAFDQIVNHAATIRSMFGGQVRVPLVLRMPQGGGNQLGPVHSHSWEALFLHVPGLLVAVPSTPADAKGLLKAAIRADDPVVFIEHEHLYGTRGEVPEGDGHVPGLGRAAVRREGSDMTLIGTSRMAHTALAAAETLARDHGVEAEVIDPRTLRPLDLDTLLGSVRRTARCVVVEEGWPNGGVGATLAALIGEHAFEHLAAPVARVTGADVPMPYARSLERVAVPDAADVVRAALALLARGTGRGRAAKLQDVSENGSEQQGAVAETPAGATVTETGTAKGDVAVLELNRAQQLVARRIAEAKATVPEATLSTEADLEEALSLLAQLAPENLEVAPRVGDLVVKAVALALRAVPRANASFRDGRFELYSRVNVGITVVAQESLAVPTIFDADRKAVAEIAREAAALTAKAQAGELASPEVSNATFTVFDLATPGVGTGTAIINPPQAGILTVGAPEPRAVPRDGAVAVRTSAQLTLTCDHRILYGADATRFLARVRELLERPAALLL